MTKKLTACFLCLLLTLSAGLTAFGLAENEEGKIQLISSLGIMNGYEDGDFRLDNLVTRAEFTKVAIAASEYRNSVAAGLTVSPYADVPYTHWAAPYIKLAQTNKLVTGYVDSTFRPDNNVSYEEAVTVALRLLGYTTDDFGSSWPYGQVGLAANLKLTKDISRGIGEAMTRRDVLNLVYNLLNTTKKDAQDKYISIFDCTIEENVILIATTAEDSSVNSDKIYTSAGTYEIDDTFDRTLVGREGDLVLQNGDEVLYFSPYEQTVTSYTVDSVVGADLILGGKMPDFDENLTVYNKSQKSTYESIVSIANEGSRLVTYNDKNGVLEYAFLFDNDVKSTNVEDLEKYVVYSKLDSAIIAYSGGEMSQLSLVDSTTAYKDNQKSTFGSVKASLTMGDIVYVKRDAKGNISYISVETGGVDGPITVSSSNWYEPFGDVSQMSIMRDGQKVTAGDLQINDIAYYSKELNMVLAYSKKVTGIYDSAMPNRDLPESVTVSGTTYQIESVAAFDKLSSNGPFSYGDTITLLLGKDGQVADVVTAADADQTVYGYLVGTGKKEFTNSDGESYSSYYITLVQADGSEVEYVAKTDYSDRLNHVVRVRFDGGSAVATTVTGSSSLSGKVDADNYILGTERLASNIQILDVGTTDSTGLANYATVYLPRLDGMTLRSDNILYYEKNTSDQIDKLILNNVTGDAFDYGIITAASSRSGEMSASGSYTFDVAGTSQSVSSSNSSYAVSVGQAVKLNVSGNQIDTMIAIPEITEGVKSITSTYVETSSKTKYLLSDSVSVYKRTDDYKYMLIPLSEVINNDNYSYRVYYDKAPASGGRVRIIVATEKLT